MKAGRVESSPESTPQISIIIPTRNEAQNVRPLLDRLRSALADYDFEVVFVDDSNDGTADVISAEAGKFPFDVRLIARKPPQRNGLSGAVVDGFSAASGEWVCVMDADLQHPPETIMRMWEQARKSGADIVVGSRSGDLFGPHGLSRLRSLNSKILTIVARTLFPRRLKNVSDPLTGLFLVRRVGVDVASLRPDGFKILLEILVRNPALQVSEVHFEFAPRHSGESKADVREGGRFFRHLVTLRSTANPHLGRFLVVTVLSFFANTGLFLLLLNLDILPPIAAALLAAEVVWLAIFFSLEFWVFSEREIDGRRRRFWGYFLLTQLAIFLVHLPVFYVLASLLSINPAVANLAAFTLVGMIRYLLSEQWVWTRGAMTWQAQSFTYNLHDMLRIESQVPFRELDYFAADFPSSDADIQIRVDRQGTPSGFPGGINYDDQLGRFGFGLSVLPGEYTQIVVSPLLEQSPDFLFTNIVEPVLRWRLLQKGYALVNAACIARDRQAFLINAGQDLGSAVSLLCDQYGFAFLADDLTILDARGSVYAYPKPLTVEPKMLQGTDSAQYGGSKLLLAGQRLLYTRFVRQIGLWLSELDLPAATVNTYLQRYIPQPKVFLQTLYPNVKVTDSGNLYELVIAADLEQGSGNIDAAGRLQQSEIVAAFQPHPLLAEKLRIWGGEDLVERERAIINEAIQNARLLPLDVQNASWWLQIAADDADGNESARAVQSDDEKKAGLVPESHGEPESQ